MFKIEQKLENRIRELSEYRYRDSIKINDLFFQQDEQGEVGARPPENDNWEQLKIGDHWKGWDKYIWLKTTIQFPKEWEGRSILGRFDFGKTGDGNNSGFESLLFVNGSPYQGVDTNHTEVFFSQEHINQDLTLHFRLWSGLDGMEGRHLEQEHKIRQVELAWLDDNTDLLYFTAKAAIESINVMPESDLNRTKLLKILDRTFKLIDWANPGNLAFYNSIEEANQLLQSELEQLKTEEGVTIRAIGHTHIDVAWLWRLRHTREKSARSFSTVLRLMERYPDYVFLQTQPQLYDYIKNDYPDIYEGIKEKVREGKWEAGGAMWLEADANIPSGESLVRQILKGQTFFDEEFGAPAFKYLWLPDVFGYSWALPQILKKSGIEAFMTTKISWNQYNRMPHDTFYWRGIDGSEILTHFITTPDYNNSDFYTYNGVIDAPSVKEIWDEYKDKPLNQELLLSYGYGDGGGGVNREMLEMRRGLDKIPGMPNVTTGRVDEYFSELRDKVAESDQYVHTWDGELYLEYHRGTYTSQAYNKKMNRKMELSYREAEWLSTLGHLISNEWDKASQENLNEGWKIILRNQFHDIIPGSSIREVYEDSKEEYEIAETLANTVRETQENVILSGEAENSYIVFNSSPWTQSNTVCIEGLANKTGKWKTHQGDDLEAQQGDGCWYVQVKGIPSLGYTTIIFEQSEESKASGEVFTTGQNSITTPYYEIEWNDRGQLTKIYDLESGRHVLDGNPGNVFQVFEDKPLNFDAWDIDLFYQEKYKQIEQVEEITIKEIGPLRSVISFKWKYEGSAIEQDMIVYAANRRIDFKTNVEWYEHNQLLKVKFPVEVRSPEATYDIQYGNVKRPTHWNTSWDYARFESVGHQWADLSERGYGVSLLNDCKYGYDIKDNVMRLSLIKSAVHPDPEQDQGKHQFTYSLYPHSGDWYEGGTVQEAWYLNNPLSYVKGTSEKEDFSLFAASTDNVMVDAVKKAEQSDEVIVRVHEYAGKRNVLELQSDAAILEWTECDLMEKPVGETVKSSVIECKVSPYEIKTFKVKFGSN